MNLSGYITTFAMEVLGLYFVLAVFATKQFVEGQSVHNLRCIPPMIDFEAIFANTLRLRPEFRKTLEEIKERHFKPSHCTDFDSGPVDNIWALNVQRCTQGTPIEFECIETTTPEPTTTTSEATTTTTRPERVTTTDPYVVPWRRSTTTDARGIQSPATVSPNVIYRTSRPPPYVPPPTPPDSGGGRTTTTVHPGDQDTTGAYIPDPGVTGLIPTVEAVVSKQTDITTTVISVGAGVLGLLLIIGLLFLCRKKRWCSSSETWETKSQSSQKHLYVGNGATDAHLKHEKVQRQRSDCQPISAISPNLDTYDPFDPASPTIHTVYGGYNRGFVTNGRKWRPDGSVNSMGADTISEAGSQRSSVNSVPMNSRYIILREDSSSSAYNFNFHYNTLRAIDHPHALTTSGFGESSTDATLPRAIRKNRTASGGVAETDFCYSFDKGSKNSSRCASRESMASNGSDMFGSRSSIKSTGSLKNGGHVPNGMVIPVPNGVDHEPPHAHRLYKKNSSRSSSRKNSEDFDRHSQGTIDEADQGLDRSLANGQRNPAFRYDDDEINIEDPVFVESEKQWRSWGINPDADPAVTDSLVNTKNIEMFSYDNHAMERGSLPRGKAKGKNGYVDPPSQFRDPNEPAVAVIQPVKGNGNNQDWASRQNTVDRKSNTLDSRRKDSKKDNSYFRPAVSKKPSRPMKNGSIPVAATPPYSHDPSPTSTANRGRSPSSSNVSNGKLPQDSPRKNSDSKSSFLYAGGKDYSHTNGHHKPAAQVNPLPKHADVRL